MEMGENVIHNLAVVVVAAAFVATIVALVYYRKSTPERRRTMSIRLGIAAAVLAVVSAVLVRYPT
jgi:hypothetical protein